METLLLRLSLRFRLDFWSLNLMPVSYELIRDFSRQLMASRRTLILGAVVPSERWYFMFRSDMYSSSITFTPVFFFSRLISFDKSVAALRRLFIRMYSFVRMM